MKLISKVGFGFEQLMDLGSVLIAVVGVNYGERKFEEIKIAFSYVSKLGTLI